MTIITNKYNMYLLVIMAIFLIFEMNIQDKKYIEMFTNDYNIINYKKINQNQKSNMINILKDDYSDPSFISYWGTYHDLYIMLSGNTFYGMIGIKYVNGKYIIYNLYVNRKYRNKGYAKILLNFICKILKQQYNQLVAYLYCKNELLSFYYKQNWSYIKYDNYEQGNLMAKNID